MPGRERRGGRRQARDGLAALAAAGGAIGAAFVLAPRTVSRLAGLPGDRRSHWAMRMFGTRELLLGLGLYRAWRRDDPEQARLFAGLVTLSQLGDLGVTTGMLLRGSATKRIGAMVWLGALPTILLAELVRDAQKGDLSGRSRRALR